MMSTYSIVGYDPPTRELGVAAQSKFLAVGALVPWIAANVGAVATQAKTNGQYGSKALQKLKEGLDVETVLQEILSEDARHQTRQVGIIDACGNGAAFTGKVCLPWAGHIIGEHFCCQGNCLVSSAVLNAMAEAFQRTKGDLAYKLLKALQAAQSHGGERRGQQSAALMVASPQRNLMAEIDRLVDLRVDDHPRPLEELDRLLQRHRVLYGHHYRDRYVPFETHVEQCLRDVLQAIGVTNQYLRHAMNTRETILRFAQEHGYAAQHVFSENSINGVIVSEIVDRYYEQEVTKLHMPSY